MGEGREIKADGKTKGLLGICQTLSVTPEVPREWFSQRQEGRSLCDPLSDPLTQEAGK